MNPEPLIEAVGNLHVHTTASDGDGNHADVLRAAGEGRLDWLIVTDHNVRPPVPEGWKQTGNGHAVLLLIGQELHNPRRQPEASHLLCLGIETDLSSLVDRPQALIDAVIDRGGAAYLAHPIEFGTPIMPEEYPWIDWPVERYTGIELWNYMSEVKSHTRNWPRTLLLAFFPHWFIRGPFVEMRALWDRLMLQRRAPVFAVGGADAHAKTYHLGPLRRTLYPYKFLFQAVNTHVLLREPFTRALEVDRKLLTNALRSGRAWVGYDGLASTRGVRFWAQEGRRQALMGEQIEAEGKSPRLIFSVPAPAWLRILRNGEIVAEAYSARLEHETGAPGFYRAEAWRRRWGAWRGWVFCNPITIC